ncbi:MAG TPA: hypothetical protein VNI77_01355 [Nitrososphaera sp.]|nr:hypothetical protein [Nitrososphaera sp.]
MSEYFKDRTEGFDDYYRCTSEGCELSYVRNWIQLFVSMYNNDKKRRHVRFELLARMVRGGRIG